MIYIDGFVLERRNASVLAMELRLSCTNPSIWICAMYFSDTWLISNSKERQFCDSNEKNTLKKPNKNDKINNMTDKSAFMMKSSHLCRIQGGHKNIFGKKTHDIMKSHMKGWKIRN